MSLATIPHPGAIATEQMREVDRIMIEDLGITLERMMENAGRNLAALARERFSPGSVTVLAGPGGNGGGGLVAARHLANRGLDVSITTTRDPGRFTPVPRQQAEILRRMGVPFTPEPAAADLIIDAVIGYSIDGDPRGRAAELIRWANDAAVPILALDGPSGLDLTTGRAGKPTIGAAATMTLALPKQGLAEHPKVVGQLYLADISVPPSVYRRFGLDVGNLFDNGYVVRIAP
jgi:NAD(P)H-hydrate epimerase